MGKNSLRTCAEVLEHYKRKMDVHDLYPLSEPVGLDDVRNISKMQRYGTGDERAAFREVMSRYFRHIQPADATRLLMVSLGDESNGYVGSKNDAKLLNMLVERLPELSDKERTAGQLLNFAVRYVFAASLEKDSDIVERTQLLKTLLKRGADPNAPFALDEGISRNAVQELLFQFKNRYMNLDVLGTNYKNKVNLLGKTAIDIVKEMSRRGLAPDVPNLNGISARLSLRQYIGFDKYDEAGVLLPRKHAEKIRDILDRTPTIDNLYRETIETARSTYDFSSAARTLETKIYDLLQRYGPYTKRYADERMASLSREILMGNERDESLLPFVDALKSETMGTNVPNHLHDLLCGIAEMQKSRKSDDDPFLTASIASAISCMKGDNIDERSPMTCSELILTKMKPGPIAERLLSNLSFCVDPTTPERLGRTPLDILAERTGHELPKHMMDKLMFNRSRELARETPEREQSAQPEHEEISI